jgi:hypothetical protein
MTFKLLTSAGELVDEVDMPEPALVRFCYGERTPEKALLNEYPEFIIVRPDGSQVDWDFYHDRFEAPEYLKKKKIEEKELKKMFIPDVTKSCAKCESHRVASVSGKTSDLNFVSLGNQERDGYLPDDMGIGGGDYIEFDYCLDCGFLDGEWPLAPTTMETGSDDDDNDDDDGD